MSSTIEVTQEELRTLVDDLVEEKLIAMFGDPEDELEIRDDLKERLLRQRKEMQDGKNSHSFEDVMAKLGLE